MSGKGRGDLPASVAVVGLGLMGGSLARALKVTDRDLPVWGLDTDPEQGESATRAGAVDRWSRDPSEVLPGAELVAYAVPLGLIPELMETHRRFLGEQAVLTDLGSLKLPVVEAVTALDLSDRYLGSHPMAGSDASGFAASRADLYRGAAVYLAGDTGSERTRAKVRGMWEALGCRVVFEDAAGHDRRMVLASHLPQLVANVLASTLAEGGLTPEMLGPGGRDMTRLAGSSAHLWRDLLSAMATADATALEELAGRLEELASSLREGRLDRVTGLMKRTARWRTGGTAEAEEAGP